MYELFILNVEKAIQSPGSIYLSHLSTKDGSTKNIASTILSYFNEDDIFL